MRGKDIGASDKTSDQGSRNTSKRDGKGTSLESSTYNPSFTNLGFAQRLLNSHPAKMK